MVQISAQTAQLQRPWPDRKAASVLEQPVHPGRLTLIPRQCLPLWCSLSLGQCPTVSLPQNSPVTIIIILLRGSSKRTKSQQGCAQFCRRAFSSSSRSFLSDKILEL